ncbi:hypothetical protein DFH09DRAFT_1073313 [Mycena vulgaris]|nr:hypothetical protein DFH09DRAFT_1073313 [Mycena vulgaris]
MVPFLWLGAENKGVSHSCEQLPDTEHIEDTWSTRRRAARRGIVVGTLSPRQNATRRSNSEVACSRLGHTERDWGPQGRQSVVGFDCMLGTSVASGEGTSRGEEAAGGGGG